MSNDYKFASDTSVSVERSRSELETILSRYGADCFGYMSDPKKAIICFRVNTRSVKFMLPLPDRSDKRFWFTPTRNNRRSDKEAYAEWEQACRSKWRALLLCVKAKLEAVQSGITSFDAEFMAHFVLPNGQTVGEVMGRDMDQILGNGSFPLMLSAPVNEKCVSAV